MEIQYDMNEIKVLIKQTIKESINEILEEEMMKLRAELVQYVSDEEQRDIESLYNTPENTVEKSIEFEL